MGQPDRQLSSIGFYRIKPGVWLVGLTVAAAVLAVGVGRSAQASTVPSSDNAVALKGHVACLDKSGHPIPSDKACPTENAKYLFTALDGKTYTFAPDDPLAAMFSDTRVRVQLLQLTALQKPNSRLELVTVQSIKNGKLYDIYYYCEICNITLYAPGPCPCCRRELEFKEAPAAEP